MRLLPGICSLLLLASTAAAEPRVLRMAAIAPEGTAWARELKALSRDVESLSGGELKMKWYLGGIAGDELTAIERIRKGQLDGEAGAIFCQSLASSMRVARIPGLFRDGDEAAYALARLKPNVDAEMRQSGFANLGIASFGFDAIFSRQPVKGMADLRRGKVWIWSLDPIWKAMVAAMGIQAVASPVEEAGHVFEDQKLDAFIAAPTAALAYQWSTQTRHFTTLQTALLPGCMVISNLTFDSLPLPQQQAIRAAVAKFFARFNDVNKDMEAQLTGKLFEKQGLAHVEASEQFRSEFYEAAKVARERLGDQLAPKALVAKVTEWVAEYRAQHTAQAGTKSRAQP
jgi:TRAP-type C4-dicarboxylate transport system substrate-binding protein